MTDLFSLLATKTKTVMFLFSPKIFCATASREQRRFFLITRYLGQIVKLGKSITQGTYLWHNKLEN